MGRTGSRPGGCSQRRARAAVPAEGVAAQSPRGHRDEVADTEGCVTTCEQRTREQTTNRRQSQLVKGKVAQLCQTLCDSMDYTVWGILQAGIVEWVAFPFSRDLPNPGIEPRSLTLQADSLPAGPPGKPPRVGTKEK